MLLPDDEDSDEPLCPLLLPQPINTIEPDSISRNETCFSELVRSTAAPLSGSGFGDHGGQRSVGPDQAAKL